MSTTVEIPAPWFTPRTLICKMRPGGKLVDCRSKALTNRYPSGWQQNKSTSVWHYHPGNTFMGMAACEGFYRTSSVFHKEPAGSILCQKCIRKMPKIAEGLEKLRIYGPPDLPPGIH